MIKVDNLYFSYGETPIFDNASFIVGKNQKVGLVGKNGAGKSTLLKLLIGEIPIGKGTIEINGALGYLSQEITFDESLIKAQSIRDYLDPINTRQDFELVTLLKGLELRTFACREQSMVKWISDYKENIYRVFDTYPNQLHSYKSCRSSVVWEP